MFEPRPPGKERGRERERQKEHCDTEKIVWKTCCWMWKYTFCSAVRRSYNVLFPSVRKSLGTTAVVFESECVCVCVCYGQWSIEQRAVDQTIHTLLCPCVIWGGERINTYCIKLRRPSARQFSLVQLKGRSEYEIKRITSPSWTKGNVRLDKDKDKHYVAL